MRKIIYTVNINKSKYIFIALALVILILPIVAPLISKSEKGEERYKEEDEFSISDWSVETKELGIKVDKVKVYLTKEKKTVEMNIEEYLPEVLAGEMPANFHIEALKAQAVAARTFAISRTKSVGGNPCPNAEGADLCDTVHCQVYMSKEERFKQWPESQREELWNKIVSAVKATEGQVLTYEGKVVSRPQYFAASSGKTEDAEAVFGVNTPYLKSVESPGEEIAKESYKKIYEFKYSSLANTINKALPAAKVTAKNLHKQLEIQETSEAGTVLKLKVGNTTIAGSQFRSILNLNSANFTFNFTTNTVKIQCKGYGHGVGMSQWGANVMGKNGDNYIQILTHYYQGTKIEKLQ